MACQKEAARIGDALKLRSDGRLPHLHHSVSENNTDTFRGQGNTMLDQLTTNKEGQEFPLVVGLSDSHEISSMNPMNFTRSDLNVSNNVQLDLLLQNH